MIYQVILWWATIFLRSYFRKTIVYGVENIPRKGPLIVASNHPSAFLEASILATVLGRHVHFLVRGDMFNPRFRFVFEWTKQIPIYRQRDGISNLRKNASSFDLTYRKLAEGEAVLIFPEAKTILEKKMRPIQRGTAHLAFGTLPFLHKEQALMIQPVGINFTEPRMPGTDVVIRFGKPFQTQQASREDREAIDEFTAILSTAMSPLIIQIPDDGYERHYEVLASVYFDFVHRHRPGGTAHDDLARLATCVNHPEQYKVLLEHVHAYIHRLKRSGIGDGVFFPAMIHLNRLLVLVLLMLKSIWFLAGGWLWALTRYVVFSKIKSNTFKSPTAIGVAMLLYPMVALLFTIACLIAAWPVWYVLIWLMVMWSGVFLRSPLSLIWRVLILDIQVKRKLKESIQDFRQKVEAILIPD